MSATITSNAGRTRTVKNLGWLLRNWQSVESFAVTLPADGRPGADWECGILANLKERSGDRAYFSDFASLSVLFRWLNRPVFRGHHLSFRLPDSSAEWVIGSPEYVHAMNTDGDPARYREHIATLKAGPRN